LVAGDQSALSGLQAFFAEKPWASGDEA
jgi:hypothetical protein